jgi:hypothetical protein
MSACRLVIGEGGIERIIEIKLNKDRAEGLRTSRWNPSKGLMEACHRDREPGSGPQIERKAGGITGRSDLRKVSG